MSVPSSFRAPASDMAAAGAQFITPTRTLTSVNTLHFLAIPFPKPVFGTFKIACSEDVFLPLRRYT
jgi:hypothetical protein